MTGTVAVTDLADEPDAVFKVRQMVFVLRLATHFVFPGQGVLVEEPGMEEAEPQDVVRKSGDVDSWKVQMT